MSEPDNQEKGRQYRIAILSHLDGHLTALEIAAASGIQERTVRRHLRQMKEEGLICIHKWRRPRTSESRWSACYVAGDGIDAPAPVPQTKREERQRRKNRDTAKAHMVNPFLVLMKQVDPNCTDGRRFRCAQESARPSDQ